MEKLGWEMLKGKCANHAVKNSLNFRHPPEGECCVVSWDICEWTENKNRKKKTIVISVSFFRFQLIGSILS